MNQSISDYQIKQYIDTVFAKYDTDRSGTLEASELYLFFNDLFRQVGYNIQITPQMVQASISKIDANGDGRISKPELFMFFNYFLKQQQQQQQPQISYGPSMGQSWNAPNQMVQNAPSRNFNTPGSWQNSNTGWNQPVMNSSGWQNPQQQPYNNSWGQQSQNYNSAWGSPNPYPNNSWGPSNQPNNSGWNTPNNSGWGNPQYGSSNTMTSSATYSYGQPTPYYQR